MVKKIFRFRDAVPYQLKTQTDFQIPSLRSVFSGTESIKFLRPKTQESLPHETKGVKES